MNNKLKIKFLAVLLCFCSCLEAVEIDGLCYNLSDTTATLIHNMDGEYWGAINIPSKVTYNGKDYTVTAIGQLAFEFCTALSSVHIPESVNRIEYQAFKGCTALVSISIPSSVTNISGEVFSGCSNLREVTFCDGGKDLTLATANPMFPDSSIKKLYLGRNFAFTSTYTVSGVFSSKSLETVIFGDSVTSICDNAFVGCEIMNLPVIPLNIKKIGNRAFAECKNIKSLLIDKSDIEIGVSAFRNCTSITDISINIPIINNGVFSGCKGLKKLTLGNLVSMIDNYAFENCRFLQDVYCFSKNPPATYQSNDDNTVNNVFAYEAKYGYISYAPNVNLYVPDISVDDYKSAKPWNNFKKIEGIHIPVDSILLDSHEVTMNINTSINLLANVYPDNASNASVVWNSSNDLVVSVDNGNVSAIGGGVAIIYAKCADNLDVKDSCVVNVIIPVNGLSLSSNSQILNVGECLQLEAVVTPVNATNKKITWSSSNENVCSVINGLVTAKKIGVSIITATSEDGGYTANCTFDIVQPVTSITLNYDYISLKNIGESIQLEAKVLPEDATNKEVKWSSSNESVCVVHQGKVVAMGYGICLISAITVEGGFAATCVVNVVPSVASLELDKHELSINVGVTDKLFVQISPSSTENKNVVWSSSNDEIVAVSQDGSFTAMKSGEAWIKAVSVDNPEAKDSCKVTVIQPVTGIELSQSSCHLTQIGESFQLYATVLPEDATNKEVRWSSSNGSVCLVSKGKVVATGYGVAVAMATTADGGFLATCTVTVEDTSAINDIATDNQDEAPIYDMMGCEVQKTVKGHLYIRNGRKFIAK